MIMRSSIAFENLLATSIASQVMPESVSSTMKCILGTRGVHITMGKFQSGFLKKHIIFPGCIMFPESKYVRVEHFDPGK